ncbi:MAG: hypothetical protein WAT09_09495 [Paracoccaceae bacterium]
MKSLSRRIRQFRDQEDGLVMTELLIMLPLLIWVFMALFVYWDAFRTINQAQKATYSVSDLMSRQGDVDMTFINGMKVVTKYLMNGEPAVKIRITSVKYKASTNKMQVLFSKSPGNQLPSLTDTEMNKTTMRNRIPVMADQDSILLVETEIGYDPAFEVGIPNHVFKNFVITRPRFHQICFVGLSCPSLI